MPELNDPQQKAVVHAEGPLLVFAGAGSGKTRVITYRIANLLAEHRVPPYRILAVTFTNKAAGEMRSRLDQLAGPEVTRDLWVGTFHATCARLLRRYHDAVGLSRNFVIYDDSDQKATMARIIKARGLADRSYPPKVVLGKIHRRKREGIEPRNAEVDFGFDEEIVDLWEEYERTLKQASAVDFEDLILHVMRLAEDRHGPAGQELRQRFSHVLVDEFQDTNRVQYRLVRALAAETQNLCVVGDDDQSIYSWRGANVRNILGFRKDFESAEVIKLEQNYRSTSNIVRAALAIIERADEREPKRLWSAEPDGDPVRVNELADEREEAAFVVKTIRRELEQGTAPTEIAVFYRVHAQSRVLEEALRAESVRYQIVGGMKFFERAEVKHLLAYLRLIDNPRSDADFVRIVNVPARGIGDKTIESVLRVARERSTSAFDAVEATIESGAVKTAAAKKLGVFKRLIDDLRRAAQTDGVFDLAERTMEKTGYKQALEREDTAESDARLENLAELLGSIREFEADAEDAGEPPTLAGYLERVSLVADVDGLREDAGVTLMTVHGAKGLEFDAVLLTGMEEETFPYKGVDGTSPEELDEERRLAYVAVTRARKRLYVTHVGARMLFGRTRYATVSRFIDDLPPHDVERTARSSPRPSWMGRRDAVSGSSDRSSRGTSLDRLDVDPGTPRRSPAPPSGERVIDYDAFDDLADERAEDVRPGSRVYHRRFGEGVVQRVDRGASPAVVANFPGFGSRKVLFEYLSFE